MTTRSVRLALLAGSLLIAPACAHRVTLDHARFDREISTTNANANSIRVYVDHRLKVTYKHPRRGDTTVDRDIHLGGRRNILHHVVGKRTSGKLVAIQTRRGRTLLFVAFVDECEAIDCAFGFLADADNARFTLVEVPTRITATTTTVRARDRARFRTLTRGFLHHLSEPAQVFRAARRRRGPLTVDLAVVEHYKPKRVRYRIDDGADDDRRERDLVSQAPPQTKD